MMAMHDFQTEMKKKLVIISLFFGKGKYGMDKNTEVLRMNNDKKAVKALKAARVLIDYLNSEESFSNNTMWVDSRGYALHTDIGYFFKGLNRLTDLLAKRCRGAIPEFPMACVKHKERED